MTHRRHRLSIEHDYVRRAERRNSIDEDYESGMPVKDIANKYDMATGTIYKTVGKNGPTLRNRHWSAEEKALVIKAYEDGWPVKAIVDRFECDRKSIWTWVVAAKVPLRQKHRKKT